MKEVVRPKMKLQVVQLFQFCTLKNEEKKKMVLYKDMVHFELNTEHIFLLKRAPIIFYLQLQVCKFGSIDFY